MKKESELLEQIGHRDGMTVPEGYFDDFAARMAQQLEPTDFEQSATVPSIVKPHTFWHRVRPYVYMAAMFAGVWCMLKMFTLMSPASSDSQYPTSPVMAEALGNEIFVNDYVLDNISQYDLIDELMEDGFDMDDFADFTDDTDDYLNTQMQLQ